MSESRIGWLQRCLVVALAGAGLGPLGGLPPAAGQQTQAGPGLESLFATGGMLQDRNGDGFVDFVAAGLVLGEAPSPSDLAAAVDVAARLGFETMAMDVPVPREAFGS